MGENKVNLHPGFRFNPFENELINFYLKPKVKGEKLSCNVVEERQLYGSNANPWQVFDPENHPWIFSEVSCGKFEKIAYAFVNLTKIAANSNNNKSHSHVGREKYMKKAGCGTWDGQTKRTEIRDYDGKLIGERRMLVFEINEVSEDLSGVGHWRMHEYHLCGVNKDIPNLSNTVLCKITLDHSKKPAIKLLPNKTTRPIKASAPEKNKTNTKKLDVVCSSSAINSAVVDTFEGISKSCGAFTTQICHNDGLVSVDNYGPKGEEELCCETACDQTCDDDDLEWINSIYDEKLDVVCSSSAINSAVVDTFEGISKSCGAFTTQICHNDGLVSVDNYGPKGEEELCCETACDQTCDDDDLEWINSIYDEKLDVVCSSSAINSAVVDTFEGISKSCGAFTTQICHNDGLVSVDNYGPKGEEELCCETACDQTCDDDDLEWINSIYDGCSVLEKVKNGPVTDDDDMDWINNIFVSKEGEDGNLYINMSEFKFPSYPEHEDGQPLVDVTNNMGKRKLQAETSYAVCMLVSLAIYMMPEDTSAFLVSLLFGHGPMLGGNLLVAFALAFRFQHTLLTGLAFGIATVLGAWRPLQLLLSKKNKVFSKYRHSSVNVTL